MSVFAYMARDGQRNAHTGEIERRTVDEVAEYLRERGLTPVRIAERAGRNQLWEGLRRSLAGRPQLVDLIFFCRQMFSITKAGVPLHRGVRSLGESIRHPVLRRALADIRRQLEEGQPLSAAMAVHRAVFPGLMINLIRVGEHTGRLDQAFSELQRNLELEQSTGRKVKAALRYPIMVIGAIVVAVVIVNLFVLPAFARVFAGFNTELPIFTRMLLASSNLVSDWWMHGLALLTALAVAIRSFVRSPTGAEWWGRWSLRIPFLGPILLKAAMARFSRTLSMCMRSGIVIDQAIQAVAAASNNRYFALRLASMRERLAQGESLTLAARRADLFTPLVMQMVSTGEETGRLDEMLDEAADFYEREVDYDVRMLGDYIEPVLLVVVSAMVLVLALGIFLPMWDFGQVALRGGR